MHVNGIPFFLKHLFPRFLFPSLIMYLLSHSLYTSTLNACTCTMYYVTFNKYEYNLVFDWLSSDPSSKHVAVSGHVHSPAATCTCTNQCSFLTAKGFSIVTCVC